MEEATPSQTPDRSWRKMREQRRGGGFALRLLLVARGGWWALVGSPERGGWRPLFSAPDDAAHRQGHLLFRWALGGELTGLGGFESCPCLSFTASKVTVPQVVGTTQATAPWRTICDRPSI